MTEIMKQFFKPLRVAHPPYIELRGRSSLYCDGACRITDYSEKRIELCFGNESLEIVGNGLALRHLSAERLAIDGRIDAVGFLPADKISVR